MHVFPFRRRLRRRKLPINLFLDRSIPTSLKSIHPRNLFPLQRNLLTLHFSPSIKKERPQKSPRHKSPKKRRTITPTPRRRQLRLLLISPRLTHRKRTQQISQQCHGSIPTNRNPNRRHDELRRRNPKYLRSAIFQSIKEKKRKKNSNEFFKPT